MWKAIQKNPLPTLLIIVTLIISFFLRAQETLTNNYLFLIDQGRDLLGVKGIVFDHNLTLIGPYTSLGGVFQGPLWYYLLSIPVFIFNGNPWGTIFLMLLISICATLIAFFWMKRLFGLTAAVVTLIFFTVSPEAVAAATYSWNPHPMWLVLTIYAFVLYTTASGKSKFHLLLWPLIALMFHFETALAVFILFATLLVFLLSHRKLLITKHFVIGLALSFLFFLPQILFDLRHDFLMSRSVLEILSGKDQGLIVKGESREYSALLLNHFSHFRYNYETTFLHLGIFKNFPLVVFLLSIAIVIFKRNSFTKHEKLFLLTLFQVILLVILMFTFLYPFPMRYWYITAFQVFFLLLTGLIYSKLWSIKLGKITLIVLFLIFGIHSLSRINTLYFNPPDDGGVAKIKGKLDAIDYIYKDAKDEKFNLLVFTPPVNTDAYDYLIWWHGRKNYNYTPPKEKKGTFYLLIEPDPGQPWSYNGWLETVIKTGKVVKTETLPSGFIIQKRIEEVKNNASETSPQPFQ